VGFSAGPASLGQKRAQLLLGREVTMTAIEAIGGAGRSSGTQQAERWLGGRFGLEERISIGDGAESCGISAWKATDQLLCRPVTVHLLPPGQPVPRIVVETVQAAARVNDPRLATIYDTDYGAEHPYIVSEWAPGTHLEDLLLSGLPAPALAAAMIADAADAVAVAHQAGRPHLCLTPRCLRWDPHRGLKITGLGIDAALRGAGNGDPLDDTRALGRMLYALLTGCWPGGGPSALPPAPRYKGQVCTPRQVRAGVPAILDVIAYRAMRGQAPDAPLRPLFPAGLALALRGVQRPSYQMAVSRAPEAEERPVPSARRARHARGRSGLRRTALLRPAA
jgi:hypothetical protein